jgi:ribosomal protein L34
MGSGEQNWPEWWNWELELTPHLFKRMEDRDFNEVDLRRMLEHALRYRPDAVDGRWVINARHDRRRWEIIVEPDECEQLLIVVTAYPIAR